MDRFRPELPSWITPLELDQRAAGVKGGAFRAFRRIQSAWVEGRDFYVLDHALDRDAIAQLRAAGRIYASTINLVLMSPALSDDVLAQMRRMTTDPAE